MTLTEEVLESDGQQISLGVKIISSNQAKAFRILTPNNWNSRGQWLLTRTSSEGYALESPHIDKKLNPAEIQAIWLSAFVPFETRSKSPRFRRITGQFEGANLDCSETTLAAMAGGQEAELTLIECPTEPWRTFQISLRIKDEVLWRYSRQGFVVKAPRAD